MTLALSVLLIICGAILVAAAGILAWIYIRGEGPGWLLVALGFAATSGLVLVIAGITLRTGLGAPDSIVWERAGPDNEAVEKIAGEAPVPAEEPEFPPGSCEALGIEYWLAPDGSARDPDDSNLKLECTPALTQAGITEGEIPSFAELAAGEAITSTEGTPPVTTPGEVPTFAELAQQGAAALAEQGLEPEAGSEQPSISSHSWWKRNGGIVATVAAIALFIGGWLLTRRKQPPGQSRTSRTRRASSSRPYPRGQTNI